MDEDYLMSVLTREDLTHGAKTYHLMFVLTREDLTHGAKTHPD